MAGGGDPIRTIVCKLCKGLHTGYVGLYEVSICSRIIALAHMRQATIQFGHTTSGMRQRFQQGKRAKNT